MNENFTLLNFINTRDFVTLSEAF